MTNASAVPVADTESPPAPPFSLAVDVVLQLGVYFALHSLLHTTQLLALVTATALCALRIVARWVKRRSVDSLEVLALTLFGASIAAAAVSGSPRVILVVGTFMGALLFVALTGALLLDRRQAAPVVMRLTVRGHEGRAQMWNDRVALDPRARRSLHRVDPLWITGVGVSTGASVAAALWLPLDLAVVACQAIPLLVSAVVLLATWLLLAPLRTAPPCPTAAPRTAPTEPTSTHERQNQL
ncbi:hypothetical protein GCM10023147_35010 [Tsukamurella soli]|uniref:Intracellular septation protein A n=1 Tax=Tsukamurella soli TaxID=644556 RepID=A0ABP8K082_9ACTN